MYFITLQQNNIFDLNIVLILIPTIIYSLAEYFLQLKTMSIFDRGMLFIFITLIIILCSVNPSYIIEDYITLFKICLMNSIPFTGLFVPSSEYELLKSEKLILEKELGENYEFESSNVATLGTLVVRTKQQTSKQKKILILIHGFGGGNLLWGGSLTTLAHNFKKVICVEHPGFGRSERPSWKHYDAKECMLFVTETYEKWIRIMMNNNNNNTNTLTSLDENEKFIILGHSLGSHFISAITKRNPHLISHVIYLSPAGIDNSGSQKIKKFTIKWLWNLHVGMMDILRCFGPLSPYLVDIVFKLKLKKSHPKAALHEYTPEHKQLYINYSYYNWALEASGEKLLTILLQPGASAKFPIMDWMGTTSSLYNEIVPINVDNTNINTNKSSNNSNYSLKGIKISFIFGAPSHDWMNTAAAKTFLNNLVTKEGCIDGGLHVLDNCGHSVNLDEPINFAKLVNHITL